VYLTHATLTPQLRAQFKALCQARGTQGVALGDQTARRVDDVLAAVRVVAAIDKLARFALLAQTQGLVRDQLVSREAIVQLHHLHIVGRQARLRVHRVRRRLGHVIAYHFHHGFLFKRRLEIS
jgi:hypothetical protein